jgi:hypothetical protein
MIARFEFHLQCLSSLAVARSSESVAEETGPFARDLLVASVRTRATAEYLYPW